jgi:hypothetical protein
MAKLVPLSRTEHRGKKWRRVAGYAFSRTEAVVPLVGAEVANAARAMPIAFVEQGGRYGLIGLLSPALGHNMYVTADGRWLGSYIPAWLRTYPFSLVRLKENPQSVLCYDTDSGLMVDGEGPGEAFFDADGEPSAAIKPLITILTELEKSRPQTEAGVAALAEAGVIIPWAITLKLPEREQPVTGLYRVDEAALNALGDEAFIRLRKASALPIAYAQLLSCGQLSVFTHLARVQKQLKPAVKKPVKELPPSLDQIFCLSDDDMVRFD